MPGASVLVLDLESNDRAALGELQQRQQGQQGVKVPGNVPHKLLVGSPHSDVFFAQEPAGHTAELPFRADVRARPHDGQQVLLLSQLQEVLDVQKALHIRTAVPTGKRFFSSYVRVLAGYVPKVEIAGLRLVQVPGDVSFDRVESGGPELAQTVPPILLRDAEIMQGAAVYRHIAIIQREVRLLRGQSGRNSAASVILIDAR